MFKNIYTFILILILIFYISASSILAYYREDNGKTEYFISINTMIEFRFKDKIIINEEEKLEGPNIFEIINQSIDIMEAKITDQCLEGADVVIVPFGIKEINLFDFDKAEMLINFIRDTSHLIML